MQTIKIIDTGEVKTVPNNTAHTLIEQGKAVLYRKNKVMTPDIDVSKKSRKHKRRKYRIK